MVRVGAFGKPDRPARFAVSKQNYRGIRLDGWTRIVFDISVVGGGAYLPTVRPMHMFPQGTGARQPGYRMLAIAGGRVREVGGLH